VLFGGQATSGLLNDTWGWDGTLWTQSEDIGPSARCEHALAFDSIRERVVLFGGGTPGPPWTYFADTWEWDGTEWTQMADTGPALRLGYGMTFDTKIKRVVLFGGGNASTLFADTWSWDGTEWTQEQDTGPSARNEHGLAYDAVRDRVVLFGGMDDNDTKNDTWEWDGSKWSRVADTGPAPRVEPGMVFDGTHVLLFGGSGAAGGVLGDTWSWDGNTGHKSKTSVPGHACPPGWSMIATGAAVFSLEDATRAAAFSATLGSYMNIPEPSEGLTGSACSFLAPADYNDRHDY
jgi:hypothetical protein